MVVQGGDGHDPYDSSRSQPLSWDSVARTLSVAKRADKLHRPPHVDRGGAHLEGELSPENRSLRYRKVPVASERIRVVVPDVMAGSHGIEAFAVASVLEKTGIDAEWTEAGEPEMVLDEFADFQPHCVVLTLPASGSADECSSDPFESWQLPAALTAAYRSAGLGVVALTVGASAAVLAGCVQEGAVPVVALQDLPRAIGKVVEALGLSRACRPSRNRQGTLRHSSNTTSSAARDWVDDARFEALTQLTAAERRVLFQLTLGKNAREIAQLHLVSISTVRSQIHSILRQFDVTSQLAAVAIANGTPQLRHHD